MDEFDRAPMRAKLEFALVPTDLGAFVGFETLGVLQMPSDESGSGRKDEPLWTPQEAAEYLRVSPRTLEKWRELRIGPSYIRLGSGPRAAIRYHPSLVRRFAESSVVSCTAGVLGRRMAS
ncbi:MAG TPA: helix-turn-helix domain-containing protein [Thermoanaerobaculia bacterium]|nr:helix-turn-helix domain-containing protein [Thermoanaerobaculia bacterium]